MRGLPAIPPPFRHRSAGERLREALDVINLVRTKPDPFQEPDSDLTEDNWAAALVRLHYAVDPLSADPATVERAEERKDCPPGIRFDVPDFYGAKPDGTPTYTATYRLLAMLNWTLSVHLLNGFAGHHPKEAVAWVQQHFEALSLRERTPEGYANLVLRVTQVPIRGSKGEVYDVPQLVIAASGVDTQAWLLLLDFFRENPNARDLIGKCPVCLELFEKPRKDAIYCGAACSRKARYERWKGRGGLKKRKKKRILGDA